jgi:hypothetical protein
VRFTRVGIYIGEVCARVSVFIFKNNFVIGALDLQAADFIGFL